MMRSPKLLLGVLVLVVAVGAFWFLAYAPKQEQAAALDAEIGTIRTEVATTRAQIATLRTAEASYAANYASVARLGKAVPADDDMRSLIVQLDSAARRSGVLFDAIELTANTSATPAAATPAPAPGAATGATTQAVTATLPPGASVGPAGLPTMPFSFAFGGSFGTLSNFFARLERFVETSRDRVDVSGRLLAVDGFSIKPHEEGFPLVVATIGATAYLVPKDQGTMGGGTPTGPTPGVASGPTSATAAAPAPAPAPVPTALTSIGGSR